MAYGLSIDVGTTYTAAAVLDAEEGGKPEMLGLGNRALQIPSVLYLAPDGSFLVGEQAERRAAHDPTRLVREFKRRIGDSVPIIVGGASFSAHALTAKLIRHVADVATRRMGGPPQWVVLTHPANWSQFKTDLIKQAVVLADLPPAQLVPEPVAAGYQFAVGNRMQPGDRICVYDLGGGTFDACVIAKTSDGFEILGEPVGIEQLGGADFDEAVFRHILESISRDDAIIDPADPGLPRLRRDCVEAKEALSGDVHAHITTALDTTKTTVTVTRADLEEMIRPAVSDTISATQRAIRSARLEPADLSAVVLTGGSAQIPLVSELLTAGLGVPISHAIHPKHGIALGALYAHRDGPVSNPSASRSERDDPVAEPSRRRNSRVALAAVLSALIVIATAVVLAVRGSDDGSDGDDSGGQTPVAGTSATSTASMTGSESSAGDETTTTETEPVSSSTTEVADVPQSATPLAAGVVVLHRKVDGVDQLYLFDTETSLSTGPLATAVPAQRPRVSPDRRTIVYMDTNASGENLRVIGADGSGDRPLFSDDLPGCVHYRPPAWNPIDQRQLAVVCFDSAFAYSLHIASTSGELVRTLPTNPDTWYEDPNYSADGAQILYMSRPLGDNDGSITVIDSDGSSAPRVLTSGFADTQPMWSPDNTEIVFRRQQHESSPTGGIYVMNADGTGIHQIGAVGADVSDTEPCWSVDGSSIVFRSNRGLADPSQYRFWLMNPDGSNAHLLDPSLPADAASMPSWARH